jgi:hypothetical protein
LEALRPSKQMEQVETVIWIVRSTESGKGKKKRNQFFGKVIENEKRSDGEMCE